MRIERDQSGRGAASERRRASAFFLSRERAMEADREGRRGKQDKGIVSRQCPSVCLHIVFVRDMGLAEGDTPLRGRAGLLAP